MDNSPLPIESGSTGEWKLRIGIFLAMCVAFSLWFAYDGLIGYPKKNLESIRQALPVKPDNLVANPRVREESLRALLERSRTERLKIEDLQRELGDPALDQPREHTYVGPQTVAIARLRDNQLIDIEHRAVTDARKVETPNYRITAEQVERVKQGMTEQEISRFLGEPTTRQPRRIWYAGQAVYAQFDIDETGAVIGTPLVRELEIDEGDIFVQKVLAIVLAIVSVFVAIKWIRILMFRVRVDDQGLTFRRRHIPWDAMKGLDTDDYLEKGWVDLVYDDGGREELQRLDSYHIARFKEVMQAICARKGFTLPSPPSTPETPVDSDSGVV